MLCLVQYVNRFVYNEQTHPSISQLGHQRSFVSCLPASGKDKSPAHHSKVRKTRSNSKMLVLGILEEVGVPGEALWVRRPDLFLIPGLLRCFHFWQGH